MIKLIKTQYEKNPLTKTTYNVVDVEERELSRREYNNITNEKTLKFFRSLGGSETALREYTAQGYLITELRSVSPNRQNKTIYKFNIN